MVDITGINSATLGLTPNEITLIIEAMNVWRGGPVHPSSQLVAALGFDDGFSLAAAALQYRAHLLDTIALTRVEWTKLLFLVELAFASDVFGAGVEWFGMTSLPDAQTIVDLRSLQHKLLGTTVSLGSYPA